MRISDCLLFRGFAKNLRRRNFGLLQQYLTKADIEADLIQAVLS